MPSMDISDLTHNEGMFVKNRTLYTGKNRKSYCKRRIKKMSLPKLANLLLSRSEGIKLVGILAINFGCCNRFGGLNGNYTVNGYNGMNGG